MFETFSKQKRKMSEKRQIQWLKWGKQRKLKYLKNIQVHQFKNEIKTRLIDLSELVFQINQII